MKFENFVSGNYIQQYKYKSFSPNKINIEWSWEDPAMNVLLENANRNLGELNAFTKIVPNIDLFLKMHVVKEANNSSKIEGTRTEMDEALMKKEELSPEKRDDWQEVHNYIDAMNFAINELINLPLSNRLIKETHKILLNSVRGEYKYPGEFRKSQNWIGGSSLNDAFYIPPHFDEVMNLMSDLEMFIHNDNINVPHLIKVALIHYQFETIHPFLDGNGRIGRLLITLYLVNYNILNKPSLYLSDFFEKHRTSYYDALSLARKSNDIIHWIKFFLNAVNETCIKGKQTFFSILSLKTELDNLILSFGRKAKNAKIILDLLYENPVLTVSDCVELTGFTKKTVINIFDLLENNKILVETTGFKRNKIYSFKKYLDLFS